MHFQKSFDLRNPLDDTKPKPRLLVHVVEGPGDSNPGRIRSLRFDYNVSPGDWLMVQWRKSGGRIVGCDSVNIGSPHDKNGAFFLLEAFDSDPSERKRTTGKELFLEWSKRAEAGEKVEAFPDEWMPQRVLDARRGAAEKAKPWKIPKFEEPKSAKS